jgi:hypothetical protein
MIIKNKIEVCLAEIMGVKVLISRNGTKYYVVVLQVSNQDVTNKKIEVCFFENSYTFSISDFVEKVGTNEEEEMIGKLFYCSIGNNTKGYPELKDFYMTVDRSKLFYDPRKKELLERRVQGNVSLKGLAWRNEDE